MVSYTTLGEFPARSIGWDLILEMALGAAVVAGRPVGYRRRLLDTMGVHLPGALAGEDAGFNVPAVLVVLVVTALLVCGVKVSSRSTGFIVTIKIAVILFVIVAGLFFVKAATTTRSSASHSTRTWTGSRRR